MNDNEILQNKKLAKKIGTVFCIVSIAFVIQLFGSISTKSVALTSDTLHLFTDLIALGVAFAAAILSISTKYRNNFSKIELSAAFIQCSMLLGVAIYAIIRGLKSIREPHIFLGQELLLFALAGFLANVLCVFILFKDRKQNLNVKALFLEVISDGFGSLLVIAVAFSVIFFNFYQADAIAAFILAGIIIPRAIYILRQTMKRMNISFGKKIIAVTISLCISFAVGIGSSKLHQIFFPETLHLQPPDVSEYVWKNENITLKFNQNLNQAVLNNGCETGVANYELAYGGATLSDFDVSIDNNCENQKDINENSEIFNVSLVYIDETYANLQLFTIEDNSGPILLLYSDERREEQKITDRWWKFWEIIYQF